MLKELFPYLEEVKPQAGEVWHNVPADKIIEVCGTLRDNHKFDCLSCLTGTDRGDFFEVVYHLFSYEKKEGVVLKVRLPVIASPKGETIPCTQFSKGDCFTDARNDKHVQSIPSVSSVWPSANWMEREVFDLLGINFESHPDLRRIMLPEDWVGHPLQKSYKEPEEYCGMTTKR